MLTVVVVVTAVVEEAVTVAVIAEAESQSIIHAWCEHGCSWQDRYRRQQCSHRTMQYLWS